MFFPLIAALAAAIAPPAADRAADIQRRIADPDGGLIVVAHRGCHAAAPGHKLASAPENSFDALDHCVALGVDVMETDVRRAGDGTLVMIHDATLDRTTDGTGPITAKSWPELRALRLKADLGGPQAALTDQRIVTLDEMLAHARGRIVLNLDVKDGAYPEVIAAVERAGATGRVIVKTLASTASLPLADVTPYDRVPFMPVLRYPRDEGQLLDVVRRQLAGTRRPLGFELPHLTPAVLPALGDLARRNRVRLWMNTLDDGYVAAWGGDRQAAADPARVWGQFAKVGISMIQTDDPEGLMAYAAAANPGWK